ncbi:MAG: hypothetical protein WCH99_07485 [Verrucomicrobiota bacterium]
MAEIKKYAIAMWGWPAQQANPRGRFITSVYFQLAETQHRQTKKSQSESTLLIVPQLWQRTSHIIPFPWTSSFDFSDHPNPPFAFVSLASSVAGLALYVFSIYDFFRFCYSDFYILPRHWGEAISV